MKGYGGATMPACAIQAGVSAGRLWGRLISSLLWRAVRQQVDVLRQLHQVRIVTAISGIAAPILNTGVDD
jgi:hypothetical protein